MSAAAAEAATQDGGPCPRRGDGPPSHPRPEQRPASCPATPPANVAGMHIGHVGTSISLNQVVLGRMRRQRELGHRVTALCPDDEWAAAIRDAGIRVLDVPWVRHDVGASLRAAAKTRAVCRRERFDVVHTHNALPGLFGRPAARLAGQRIVVHTVRAWPLNESRSALQRLGMHVMEPIASRSCDAILFQNPDDLATWSALPGVPRERACLVGNGLDVAAFEARLDRSARVRVREALGVPEGACLAVVIARFEPAKGHGHLLDGLAALRGAAGREIVALLVGKGDDEPSVRARVAELGLEGTVRFAGYRSDVPDLLVAADVSVLTSLYEGIPRGLMESMVAGLPVVATDVPGTRTLVVDGGTGLLVRPGDVEGLARALHRIRSEPELAARLGRAGRERVERRFDERLVTDRVLAVYEHLRAGAPGPLPSWNLEDPGA